MENNYIISALQDAVGFFLYTMLSYTNSLHVLPSFMSDFGIDSSCRALALESSPFLQKIRDTIINLKILFFLKLITSNIIY